MEDKTDQLSFMYGDLTEIVHKGVNDTVNIPVNEYKELLEDSKFLAALESAGVDNWDGYDYAREILQAFKI